MINKIAFAILFFMLGFGYHKATHAGPDSPDCECGTYLGNEGLLGMVRAGIESPAYPVFWDMSMRVQASYIHISNTGTGRDTGLDAAFIGVRFE